MHMKVGAVLKSKIRTNLGTLLEERGLRMKWVANKIGATQSQLSNWCKNDEDGYAKSTPSVLYVLRLQKLLNVKVEEMFEE